MLAYVYVFFYMICSFIKYTVNNYWVLSLWRPLCAGGWRTKMNKTAIMSLQKKEIWPGKFISSTVLRICSLNVTSGIDFTKFLYIVPGNCQPFESQEICCRLVSPRSRCTDGVTSTEVYWVVTPVKGKGRRPAQGGGGFGLHCRSDRVSGSPLEQSCLGGNG